MKITMTILCFCRLVHQMQVIETRMIRQDSKRIGQQQSPELNSTFGIAEHQNLGLKPFFGASADQHSQTQGTPAENDNSR